MLVRMWTPIFRWQWWYVLGGNRAEERCETRGNKSVEYYWAQATQRKIVKDSIDNTLRFTLYTHSCISSQNYLVNIHQAMFLASADFLNRTGRWLKRNIGKCAGDGMSKTYRICKGSTYRTSFNGLSIDWSMFQKKNWTL